MQIVRENIKIDDLFVRNYDADFYKIVGITKVNLLAIDSPLNVELACISDANKIKYNINATFKNNILRGKTEGDEIWYPITNEELSSIELPENTEIRIKIKYHNDNTLMIRDNKCYLKTEGKFQILDRCDADRARRLLYIGFWVKI